MGKERESVGRELPELSRVHLWTGYSAGAAREPVRNHSPAWLDRSEPALGNDDLDQCRSRLWVPGKPHHRRAGLLYEEDQRPPLRCAYGCRGRALQPHRHQYREPAESWIPALAQWAALLS